MKHPPRVPGADPVTPSGRGWAGWMMTSDTSQAPSPDHDRPWLVVRCGRLCSAGPGAGGAGHRHADGQLAAGRGDPAELVQDVPPGRG